MGNLKLLVDKLWLTHLNFQLESLPEALVDAPVVHQRVHTLEQCLPLVMQRVPTML